MWAAGVCGTAPFPAPSSAVVTLVQANNSWSGNQSVGLFDNLRFGHSRKKDVIRHGRVYIWKQEILPVEDTLGPGGIEDG